MEAARPLWNKFLLVFVHLVVTCSGGGDGPVGFGLLGSAAPLYVLQMELALVQESCW